MQVSVNKSRLSNQSPLHFHIMRCLLPEYIFNVIVVLSHGAFLFMKNLKTNDQLTNQKCNQNQKTTKKKSAAYSSYLAICPEGNRFTRVPSVQFCSVGTLVISVLYRFVPYGTETKNKTKQKQLNNTLLHVWFSQGNGLIKSGQSRTCVISLSLLPCYEVEVRRCCCSLWPQKANA